VAESDVDAFLARTEFSGYQGVPLPFGRTIPGTDRTPIAEIAFRHGVEGRSVLDVGTYYGFLPYEAHRRGAVRAGGVEPDDERFAVASAVAGFNGGYEIVQSSLEDLDAAERFETVLFLNVLHHVTDPVAAFRKLASLCSELLVVEFCLADDPQNLEHVISGGPSVGVLHKVRGRARSAALRAAGWRLPIMAVGDWAYHRVFYFSPSALRNLLVVHLGLAHRVEFARSPYPGRRMVAFCWMNA
jgi:SAM-dependent methyltransferase